MSGIVNPFAQIGDYRGNNPSSNEDLVTTAYLTGLPDPRQISNEQVGLIFRQLLKRDARTKHRALTEFEHWLNGVKSSEQIEDSVHLAYVQMFAKLSIDISPQIRSQSHLILGTLYTILGKKSSKYLKYTVGPWLVGQYDPDARVSSAARDSLTKMFPSEKVDLMVEKFQDSIREFVYDSCNNATAQTLSDERYYTKEESNQKYTRLVKCCLDILVDRPSLFDLECWEISQLVESGRIWKFFSSSDSGLARSALRLANAHISDLDIHIPIVWKELLRAGRKNVGGSGVALEVLQFMNILTKRFPEETWPADESIRKDALASIGQLLAAEPPHPVRFWPLLYNLALMIPEPPTRDLTPLYKPLEKVVIKLKHNRDLEESAWGCFVSLAAKMGPSYVQRAFRAAEQRCHGSNPPIQSIAKFLSRFAETEGIADLVRSQLQKDTPLEYVLILADTRKFGTIIEELAIPKMPVRDVAMLIEKDNDLKIPSDIEFTPDPEWLMIVSKSHNVDAQHVVECLSSFGLNLDILKYSEPLYKAGVRFSLDPFVLENLNNHEVLEATVAAHGQLVSNEVARAALRSLIRLALSDQEEIRAVLRIIRPHLEFIKESINIDASVKNGVEMLAIEDRQGVLRGLSDLSISTTNGTGKEAFPTDSGIEYLDNLDLDSMDLSIPFEASVNPLRAPIPRTERSIDEGVRICERLVEALEPALEDVLEDQRDISKSGSSNNPRLDKHASKLAILARFVEAWGLVAPINKFKEFIKHSMDLNFTSSDLVSCGTSYAALYHFYQAKLVYQQFDTDMGSNEPGKEDTFDRASFKPSLHNAFTVKSCPVRGSVKFDTTQRSLIREAVANRLPSDEYMLISEDHIPESATLEIVDPEDKEDSILRVVFAVNTFGNNVKNLPALAFGSKHRVVRFAALNALLRAENDLEKDTNPLYQKWELHDLLDFASNMPQETGLDAMCAELSLSLFNAHAIESQPLELNNDPDVVQALMSRDENIDLCYLGLQALRSMDPVPPIDLSLEENLDEEPAALVSWLVALNIMDDIEFTEKSLRCIFDWIQEAIKTVRVERLKHTDLSELVKMPCRPSEMTSLVLNILYQLVDTQPNAVREWYRDLRDKAFIKQIDNALSTLIIPVLLRSVRENLESEAFDDEVEVSVNEKQREIRASRTVEEEFTVDVVISLPEQYPGKPANITIRNLSSVSEAKKRGWLLEARQKMQTGGVMVALKSILTRLHNFLDGIEPCAICYMTVNDLSKLPNKDCSQCHNIYHTDCLYKWFSTNGNKLCPMCRTPM